MSDTLTFLVSPHAIATKVWSPLGASDYQIPKGPFQVLRAPLASLPELLEVLSACPANAFHVRGAPIGGAESIPYRRTKQHGDEPPTLGSETHRVIPVDYDGQVGPAMTDLETAARAVRASLPEPLRGAACIAQATSSAGMKPGLRVRLWFWADRPVSDDECRQLLDICTEADHSIYAPHQPIYVAPPRFQGLPDPFPTRWRLLEGDTLVLPPQMPSAELRGIQSLLQGLGKAQIPGQTFAQGGRNQALTSIAGSMRARGLEPTAIAAALEAHNETHCTPPLPRDEVLAIAQNVGKYEPTAVPQTSTPVTDLAAEKEVRRQVKRLTKDPALLPSAACAIKPFLVSGAVTETYVCNSIVSKTHLPPGDVLDALRGAPLLAPTTGRPVEDWQLGLKTSAEGGFTPGPENQLRVFEAHPDIALWYDERADSPVWERCPWGAVPREYHADHDPERARVWLEQTCGWLDAPRNPHHTIVLVAHQRCVDPWRVWLESLQWDGTQRLAAMAEDVFGAHDKAESATLGWWMISAVARTFAPGCEVHHVIVLEGDQGVGKTQFFYRLVGLPRYYDRIAATGDLNNPRVLEKLQGPVVVELAELAAISKRDTGATKEFLDATQDKWRPLWSHQRVTTPRRCVFAGTTNDADYLRDPTGNRRFWPIACARVDLDYFVGARDQLWAEAVHLYRAGARWWPTPQEAQQLGLAERVDARRADEFGEAEITRLLDLDWSTSPAVAGPPPQPWMLDDGRLNRLTLPWLAEHLGVALDSRNRMTGALKYLGWRSTVRRIDGTNTRMWVRK